MSDHHTRHERPKTEVSRRVFLRRSSELSFAAAVTITAGGALLNASEAWALDVKGLQPETMKTLILVARDIYPHDKVADRFYAIAMKPYDEKAAGDPATKAQLEAFVAGLDAAAGKGGYAGLGWESQRAALLRAVSASPMFETIRSGLIVSLYNNPEVWPIFGYEGESYSKGGYITRGFDDIDWI
ncbi:gluconate 2-dehydrogenase subunit 3 family protein [Bradyrhizobium sp.]|uniref:gluconate 2-dehydrogenase subunit 3 family protein n=1 Tax=Bradyrhizobium sp. TaxID=376 RepID=UPI001ED73A20|nr:gluconate 2-dehydrogenase subunit 3 family protein [Bradyrhizobium sp.]MBV9980967.1 gluconate 2-dehydrogenase subunit 3 family protein [Bradyrhizobium sp.]